MRLLTLVLCAALAFAQAPNVVFVGDSYTWGYQAGVQQASNYPAVTLPLLHPRADVTLYNLGQSGQAMGPKATAKTFLACGDAACTFTDPPAGTFPSVDSYRQDGKYNILVLENGTPTINLISGTGAALYAYWTQYYSERKAAGWDKVIVAGVLFPVGGTDDASCSKSAIAHGVTATNAAPAPSTCVCPSANCSVAIDGFWGCCGVNQLLAAGQGVAWDVYLPLSTTAGFSNWDAPNTYKQSDNHWTVALNYIMALKVAAKVNTSWIFPMGGAVNGNR